MKKTIIFCFIFLITYAIKVTARPSSNNIFDYKHQQTDVGIPLMNPVNNYENAFVPF